MRTKILNFAALILVSLFVGGFVFGCSPDAPPQQVSMKGYELYSWKNSAGGWNYALLLGTNRNKTPNELIDAQTSNRADIERSIAALPQGESILWTATSSFSSIQIILPDDASVERIKQICAERKIQLSIVK